MIKIGYDPEKRRRNIEVRGIDFEDAALLFEGPTYSFVDDRFEYDEVRMHTAGMLADRMFVVIWTLRGDVRHVISMRKANDREQAKYQERLGQD